MKLLRLTTDDSEGIFECSLNQELIVAKQSQIALGSAALELNDEPIVISPANNRLTYQVLANFPRTARLTPGTFNNNNAGALFADVTNKLNEGIGRTAGAVLNGRSALEIGSATEIGVQWRLERDKKGFMELASLRSQSKMNHTELLANIPEKALGVGAAIVQKPAVFTQTTLSGSARNLMSGTSETQTAAAGTEYRCTVPQTYPMTKGCGIHRARIKTLLRGTSNAFNPAATALGKGFSISVHNVSPLTYLHNRDMTINDITFGIKCDSLVSPGNGGAANTGVPTGQYIGIVNGVPLAGSGVVPNGGAFISTANDNQKDVVSIEILAGTVRGVVYVNGGPNNLPTPRIIFEAPYNSTDDLFGSYSFHGGGQMKNAGGDIVPGDVGCVLNHIRYTGDPYLERAAEVQDALDGFLTIEPPYIDDGVYAGVAASTPLPQSQSNSVHSVEFQTTAIADWFGFNTRFLTRTEQEPVFVGTTTFKSHLQNDCFLLEMLNLPVDSYDFIESKKKRVNLLSVIPFDDDDGKCIYDPSHLIFLDVNNSKELRLRDIRCRLVRSDYTPVALTGLSTLVLYIKDKSEGGTSFA